MIIVGAAGRVEDSDKLLEKLGQISKERDIEIVAVDAGYVCGKDHIVSAYRHAVRAFEEGRNSMKKFSMEILLYISGERQIKNAIQKIGIKDGIENVVFIFMDASDYENLKGKISEDEALKIVDELGFRIDNDVLKPSREKLKAMGFGDEEIETVSKDKYSDLILEKVAMVDVIK